MSITILHLIILFSILFVVLTIGGLLIWLERRLLGLWQDRYGPNRVGPFGLLQVLADMIKVFTKEDWIPPFADKAVFIIAPAVIVIVVLMSFTIIPFAPGIAVVDLNIGLLFFLAMSSLGVYSVALAGWASSSKYSLLGGLRASAQMLSYEVFMIVLMGVVMIAGSSTREIVSAAPPVCGYVPSSFLSPVSETHRLLDLPAESEPAGHRPEYSDEVRYVLVGEYPVSLSSLRSR
jgi:NADH-quinone oxidoreductase subunit H